MVGFPLKKRMVGRWFISFWGKKAFFLRCELLVSGRALFFHIRVCQVCFSSEFVTFCRCVCYLLKKGTEGSKLRHVTASRWLASNAVGGNSSRCKFHWGFRMFEICDIYKKVDMNVRPYQYIYDPNVIRYWNQPGFRVLLTSAMNIMSSKKKHDTWDVLHSAPENGWLEY